MMNELALFLGGGGGALGSVLLGHRIVCGVEIDPYCREVVMRRQEEGHLPPFPLWDDVTTFDGRPWCGIVDLITAGFPCQPFSLAGRRRGAADERNRWPDTFRIIQEVRPRYVMLENVPGIRKYLPIVIRDLRRAGYTVERPLVVAAASVGAGHIRRRVWIFAYDQKQYRGEQAKQQTQDNRGVPEISPDDIRGRFGQQPGRRTGQDRAVETFGEDAAQTDLFADYDGFREHEPEGDIGEGGGWDRDNIAENIPADDEHAGLSQWQGVRGDNAEELPAAQRDSGRRCAFWDAEPGLARLVRRPTNRVERIRITGNIQVPAVVRLAWETLTKGIL